MLLQQNSNVVATFDILYCMPMATSMHTCTHWRFPLVVTPKSKVLRKRDTDDSGRVQMDAGMFVLRPVQQASSQYTIVVLVSILLKMSIELSTRGYHY